MNTTNTLTEEIANDPAMAIKGLGTPWVLTLGIVMTVLGAIALYLSAATTLLSILFIGALLFISGAAHIIYTFTSKETWRSMLLHIVLGVLYLIAGAFMFTNPVDGAIVFTGVLAVAFLVNGISRIVISFMRRFRGWGYAACSGLVTAALGAYILMIWPLASFFILGLLVGLDLLFFGVYLVTLALSKRSEVVTPTPVSQKPAYT